MPFHLNFFLPTSGYDARCDSVKELTPQILQILLLAQLEGGILPSLMNK